MDDERLSDRVVIAEPLTALLYFDSDETIFLSTDSSKGGLRIEGDVEFEIGETIGLVYDLADDRFVEGEGTVQWCAPIRGGRFNAGFEFADARQSGEFTDPSGDGNAIDERSPGIHEKRIYPRFKQSTKVYTGGIQASIYDLSETGCSIQSEKLIDPGKFIALVFSTAKKARIKFHGKIKWCRQAEADGAFQHGVEIWHINEACRESYGKLLRKLSG